MLSLTKVSEEQRVEIIKNLTAEENKFMELVLQGELAYRALKERDATARQQAVWSGLASGLSKSLESIPKSLEQISSQSPQPQVNQGYVYPTPYGNAQQQQLYYQQEQVEELKKIRQKLE